MCKSGKNWITASGSES
ncbi:MAG: KxYKxGKxW signal peptide domain-containing protein [Oribacterium sp.]|nr:KxYKxGKxW signal peptide domain-containing protein [Oribacterium sp.]